MSLKREHSVDESTMADVPMAKRLRRSALSSAAEEQARFCRELFTSLREFTNSEGAYISRPFLRLPSKKSLPEYYSVIENPIDLTQIHEKVKTDEYSHVDRFMEDINLLVENAKRFYGEGSSEYADASELWNQIVELRSKQEYNSDSHSEISTRSPESSPSRSSRSYRSFSPHRLHRTKENPSPMSGCEAVSVHVFEHLLASVLNERCEGGGRLLCDAFRLLPSKELWPDYYETIRDPIDLQLIARRVRSGRYRNLNDIERDFNLLCRNARLFNEPGSQVYRDAKAIRKFILKKKVELLDAGCKSIDRNLMSNDSAVVDRLLNLTEQDLAMEEDSDDEQLPLETERQVKYLYSFLRNWRENGADQSIVEPFLRLPDKRTNAEYYNNVDSPVSFFVINKRLKNGCYENVNALLEDIVQLCSNVKATNLQNSFLYNRAVKLEELACRKVREINNMPGTSEPCTSTSTARTDYLEVDNGESGFSSVNSSAVQMDTTTSVEPDESQAMFKEKLLTIFNAVVNYRDETGRFVASAFMEKPSKKLYPDYYKVIPEPIDLNTIRNAIEGDKYSSSQAFAADFELLFENARHYNEDYSVIYTDANTLNQIFLAAMSRVCPTPIYSTKANHFTNKGRKLFSRESTLSGCLRVQSGSDAANVITNVNINAITTTTTTTAISAPQTVAAASPVQRFQRAAAARGVGFCNNTLELKLQTLFRRVRDYVDCRGRVLSTMFQKLPPKSDYPDYYDVIKKPIDLQKIQSRIMLGQYERLDALVADLALVFDNACKYNDPESQIYKDALMLQRVMLLKQTELQSDEKARGSVDVQVAVQELLMNLFLGMQTYIGSQGRCVFDSFYRMQEIFDVDKESLTFEKIKRNLEKKRYRRMDRFQQDIFHLFSEIRRYKGPGDQMWNDAIELQTFFIRTRDQLAKRGEWFYSPAMAFSEKDLHREVEDDCKAYKLRNEIEEKRDHLKTLLSKHKMGDIDMTKHEWNGVCYCIGDFAYVKPIDGKSTRMHIMQIHRLWKDSGTNEVMVFGRWLYQPWETYHLLSRTFLQNEVFLSEKFDHIDAKRLSGKCCVLFIKKYLQYRVLNFDEKDVYVCESLYIKRGKQFRKLLTWDTDLPGAEWLQLEERSEPLVPVRVPSIFAQTDEQQQQSSAAADISSEDSDHDCSVLQMERVEVIAPNNSNSNQCGEVDFEQLYAQDGIWLKLGDSVYVRNSDGDSKIVFVERLWKAENNQAFLSGVAFVDPSRVEHEPTRLFYRNELFALDNGQSYPVSSVYGLCAVLSYKDYCAFRPTELTEEQIYLCDLRVVLGQQSKFIIPENHEKKFRFKAFRLSADVLEDEILFFKKTVLPEKVASPYLMKRELAVNMDDYVADSPDQDSSDQFMFHDIQSTPKLTSRSKSGYILFSAVARKRIMAENPDCSFGSISKIVGAEWKKLSKSEKKRYEEEAQRIAEEREKADADVGGRFHLLPGQIRVYCCRWKDCDYQFENAEQLNEHVTNVHTSQIVEAGDNQYVCLWHTCTKYRKDGKPFPSMPRLHRHIREKHVPASAKCIYAQNRSRNYMPVAVVDSPRACDNFSPSTQPTVAPQITQSILAAQLLSQPVVQTTQGGGVYPYPTTPVQSMHYSHNVEASSTHAVHPENGRLIYENQNMPLYAALPQNSAIRIPAEVANLHPNIEANVGAETNQPLYGIQEGSVVQPGQQQMIERFGAPVQQAPSSAAPEESLLPVFVAIPKKPNPISSDAAVYLSAIEGILSGASSRSGNVVHVGKYFSKIPQTDEELIQGYLRMQRRLFLEGQETRGMQTGFWFLKPGFLVNESIKHKKSLQECLALPWSTVHNLNLVLRNGPCPLLKLLVY
ncbi:Protein polybromo-1 [Trichinella pseudospiralis]|uniref:Protein polybromo-1 n=1 Tax=Trichinella pseudospiralis TaxID=6337 RepID=A0A0V1EX52_TRIPS|nr:Protein polybromo-1 [Trichinella pseudospiralis]